MKKVLLIGPCNPNIRTGQFLSPPLGIHRIASNLKNRKIADVDVVDPSLDREETYRKLDSTKYDLIGHSTLYPTIAEDLKIIFDAHDRQPEALKVLGGQGASFNHKEFIENTPIKALVRGFGEHQLEKILLSDDKDISDISGMYISENGTSQTTGFLEKMTPEEFREISMNLNFNDIPYERYWSFMEDRYSADHLKIMKNEGMLKTIRLMTSNYCPMGCTFCSSTNFLNEASKTKQGLLQLSPEDVTTLMKKAALAHPGVESFYFNDDNFMSDKGRTEEVCYMIERLDRGYNLMCMGRVDNSDHYTLSKMKKAGFQIIFYGIETFSSKSAKDVKKTARDDYESIARKAVIDTLDAGLVPQMSLMLFLPTSREEDLVTTIENTVDLMEQGARVTVFPYVEAYSGAEIIKHHELNYKEFEVRGHKFNLPTYVLPDDKNILRLAEESLMLKQNINQNSGYSKGTILPQPIDSLNLFMAVYMHLGRSTDRIEQVIRKMV